MIIVNGRQYPFWSQFVERSSEWIGGVLQDFGDSSMPCKMHTEITGVTLEPNGDDSAFFSINGKDFGCGFDIGHGGVSGGENGWITFSGYGGHKWRIKQGPLTPELMINR